MTRNKLIEILAFLDDTYRDFRFPKNNDDATRDMIDNWSEFIIDYDYENTREAVIEWAKDNPSWSPNAPQLMHEVEDVALRKERKERVEAIEKQIDAGAPEPDEGVESMDDVRRMME